MPDLDARIAQWRRNMLDNCVASAQSMDELESHLRDEVARLLSLNPEQAFDDAAARLGDVATLKAEFRKIGEAAQSTPARHRLFRRTAAATAATMLLTFLAYPYREMIAKLASYQELAMPVFAISMIGFAVIVALSIWASVKAHAIGTPRGRIVAASLTLTSAYLLVQWFVVSLRVPLRVDSPSAISLFAFLAGCAGLLALLLIPRRRTSVLSGRPSMA